MSELVVTELHPKARNKRARAAKVHTRRVTSAEGGAKTVFVLDTQDPEFGDQFLKVFQLNVSRARRQKAAIPPVAAE